MPPDSQLSSVLRSGVWPAGGYGCCCCPYTAVDCCCSPCWGSKTSSVGGGCCCCPYCACPRLRRTAADCCRLLVGTGAAREPDSQSTARSESPHRREVCVSSSARHRARRTCSEQVAVVGHRFFLWVRASSGPPARDYDLADRARSTQEEFRFDCSVSRSELLTTSEGVRFSRRKRAARCGHSCWRPRSRSSSSAGSAGTSSAGVSRRAERVASRPAAPPPDQGAPWCSPRIEHPESGAKGRAPDAAPPCRAASTAPGRATVLADATAQGPGLHCSPRAVGRRPRQRPPAGHSLPAGATHRPRGPPPDRRPARGGRVPGQNPGAGRGDPGPWSVGWDSPEHDQ